MVWRIAVHRHRVEVVGVHQLRQRYIIPRALVGLEGDAQFAICHASAGFVKIRAVAVHYNRLMTLADMEPADPGPGLASKVRRGVACAWIAAARVLC